MTPASAPRATWMPDFEFALADLDAAIAKLNAQVERMRRKNAAMRAAIRGAEGDR